MLIAFAGRKGSGKSTAAKFLVDHNGFLPINFADPMKAFLQYNLGVPVHYLENDKEAPCLELCNRSVRYTLQTLGTEWGRNMIGPIWIHRFFQQTRDRLLEGRSVVCADIRFQDELECIRQLHGTAFWVERGGATPADPHPSENSITQDYCDGTLFNTRSLNEFHKEVLQAVFPEAPLEAPPQISAKYAEPTPPLGGKTSAEILKDIDLDEGTSS